MAQFGLGELPFTLSAGQQKVGGMAIGRVYWLNPGTIGDTFTLADASGNVILTGRAEVANQSQFFDFTGSPISVNGVGVNQMTSGTLYIYTVS